MPSEKEKRVRAATEIALLMDVIDDVTVQLVARGLWPSSAKDYAGQPSGRFATASDIVTCAKSIAWKAGIRYKLDGGGESR